MRQQGRTLDAVKRAIAQVGMTQKSMIYVTCAAREADRCFKMAADTLAKETGVVIDPVRKVVAIGEGRLIFRHLGTDPRRETAGIRAEVKFDHAAFSGTPMNLAGEREWIEAQQWQEQKERNR